MLNILHIRKTNIFRILFNLFNTLFLIIVLAVIIIPLYKVFIDSFDSRSGETVFRIFPGDFTIRAYRRIFERGIIFSSLQISLLTTFLGTSIALIATSLFAYGLSIKELPGRKFFLFTALITLVFEAGMIPVFMLMKALNWVNTLLPVILAECVNAFYLLLLKNFFETIPRSLYESAEMDGAGPLQTFFFIILPLSKAGLATIGLFYGVFYWNQFIEYMLYVFNRPDLHNFQVYLQELTSDLAGGMTICAAIMTSIVPILLIYPSLQKYFKPGINLGSIKG